MSISKSALQFSDPKMLLERISKLIAHQRTVMLAKAGIQKSLEHAGFLVYTGMTVRTLSNKK